MFMVKEFALKPPSNEAHERRLMKMIRDRCEECYVPRCWPLTDPTGKGAQIYLDKTFVQGSEGRCVTLRQLLFLMEYKQHPPLGRRIVMRCWEESDNNCINPAHMRVIGFEPSYAKVHEMINRGILTLEQIPLYYGESEHD